MKKLRAYSNFFMHLWIGAATRPSGKLITTCVMLAGVLASRAALAQADLGSVDLGSSASDTVTLTLASGGTPASISVVTQGAANLDFVNASGGSCATGTVYAAQATCTVNVTFAPRFAGESYGAVVLADSGNNVLATAYLQGLGAGPQTTFLPGTLAPIKYSSVQHIVSAGALAVDAAGDIFVAGNRLNALIELTPAGDHYTESKIASGVSEPIGVALDGAGNLFVSNFAGTIYKETLVNGIYTQTTAVSGLKGVGGVAVDSAGDLYVTEGTKNGSVYKETLANGSYTQSTIGSGFRLPAGVAVDVNGNVFVADAGSLSLYLEKPSSEGYTQSTIGSGIKDIRGVAVDAEGDVYAVGVAGVFRLTPINGSYTQTLVASGGGVFPSAVAVDGSSNLFISGNSTIEPILKLDLSHPPALNLGTAAIGENTRRAPQSVSLVNYGNTPLTISTIQFPTDFLEKSSGPTQCSTIEPVNGGESCTLTVYFAPVTPVGAGTQATLSESILVTSDTLNLPTAQQQPQAISVSGTELKATPTISLAVAVSKTMVESPVTLTALVEGISGFAAPTGSVAFSTGSLALGTAPLTAGRASLTTTSLPAGTDSLTATYLGDSIYAVTPSMGAAITVNKFTPGVKLVSSALTRTVGEPVTFTATITGLAGKAAPRGSVTFYSGKTSIGLLALEGSSARLTIHSLPAGRLSITATYQGDPLYAARTSAPVFEQIAKKPQSIAFARVPAVRYGAAAINLSAYARASSGLPVGFTVLSGPGKLRGTELSFDGAGTIEIEAAQPGDSIYLAATRITVRITVQPATLTVAANNLTMNHGSQPPALTYTITGFIRGDTQKSATQGTPDLSSTVTSSSPAGSYTITVKIGSLTATNYTFVPKNGTLTVK